ncbi:hypothetical protein AC578_11037 [Pseudocercospora eumusae]|uniref:Uncharacterized protein n=1 Tax=Pseudocercospora eumusae TaxID=321146 RepID=A0A139HSK2_9PEZI|nr:hypothetical protein AC578_11037 [Pseudocercospora eumusae]
MPSILKLFTLLLTTLTTTALASPESADICFFQHGNDNCDREGQVHWCCEGKRAAGQCCRNDAGPAYCEHIGVFGLDRDNVANFYNKQECSGGLFDDITPVRDGARVCTYNFDSYEENAGFVERFAQRKCSSFWTWRTADVVEEGMSSSVKAHEDYQRPDFPPSPESEPDRYPDMPEPGRPANRPMPAIQMRPAGPGGKGKSGKQPVTARGVAPAPPSSNVTSCVGPTILGYTDDKGKQREVRFKESEIEIVKKALETKDWKTLAKIPDSGRPVPGTPEFARQEKEKIMEMDAKRARQNRTGKL